MYVYACNTRVPAVSSGQPQKAVPPPHAHTGHQLARLFPDSSSSPIVPAACPVDSARAESRMGGASSAGGVTRWEGLRRR